MAPPENKPNTTNRPPDVTPVTPPSPEKNAPKSEQERTQIESKATRDREAVEKKVNPVVLNQIENKIKQTPNTIANTPPPNAPEIKKGFLDKTMDSIGSVMEKLDYWKNQLSYFLAPVILQLKKIQIPFLKDSIGGYITMVEQFTGMDSLMLCSALRNKGIQPKFDAKNPGVDSTAITKLTEQAKLAKDKNPELDTQVFYDKVVENFANTHQGTVIIRMAELIPAATEIAEKIERVAPKIQPKEKPVSSLTIQKLGENNLELNNGAEKYNVSINKDKGTLHINDKDWKIRLLSTDSLLENKYVNHDLKVTALKNVEQTIEITTQEGGSSLVKKEELIMITQNIKDTKPHPFTQVVPGHVYGKTTRQLILEPIIV